MTYKETSYLSLSQEETGWDPQKAFVDSLKKYFDFLAQKKENELLAEINTNRVLSEIHEEIQALSFAAGLTVDEFHGVFQNYGPSHSLEIMNCLIEGKAETPDRAHELLFSEAGLEVGAMVGGWNKMRDAHSRTVRHGSPFFSMTKWEKFQESLDPPRKKRRKRNTKAKVVARAERFLKNRAKWGEQNRGDPSCCDPRVQEELDRRFDEELSVWQKKG